MSDTHKAALRKEILARRDALTVEHRRAKSCQITKKVASLVEFATAESVLLFASFGSEVDTWPLIHHALQAGKTVALPAVAVDKGNKRLVIRRITDTTNDLFPGTWGIMEPAEACPELKIAALDFILLPGVAFDQRGYRLGYGGGYYDRLIAGLPQNTGDRGLVAVAFELQIVPQVPTSDFDLPIPVIVTEKRIMHCSAQTAHS